MNKKKKARITPKIMESLVELPEELRAETIEMIKKLRLGEDEAIAHIETAKTEVFMPSPEEMKEIQKGYKRFRKHMAKILRKPEVQRRKRLFRNWFAHVDISEVLKALRCPVCNASSEKFGWICHEISARKALDLVQEKYRKSLKK